VSSNRTNRFQDDTLCFTSNKTANTIIEELSQDNQGVNWE
jgi:hypothetical protein